MTKHLLLFILAKQYIDNWQYVMNTIKVMIADDHPTFLEGLSRILNDEPDMEVVAAAANGEEAINIARQLLPDVAILDIAMPSIDGIEATRRIKEACPSTKILIISAYDYDSYAIASIRAGARGYLLKGAPLSELVNAVRMLHHGEAVFDLKVANEFLSCLDDKRDKNTESPHKLNSRELQVLKLLGKGIGNKMIANQLCIGERTVQTHLVNIFRKLNVDTRTAAVVCALKTGLLVLDDLS